MKLYYLVRNVLALAFILVALFSSCSVVNVDENENDNGDKNATSAFYYAVEITDQYALEVINLNGEIIVSGSDETDSVRVSGKRIAKAKTQAAANDALDEISVTVTSTDTKVSIRTEQPNSENGVSYQVDYEILIPKNWIVNVTNMNGLIKVERIENTVAVQNMNGDVEIDQIKASTSVGLLNGKISANIELPVDGNCELSTINGTIALDVPITTSAILKANVINGTTSLSGLTLNDMTQTIRQIEGKLGDGRGSITLSVTNGIITINGY
ncbi:hypothetical protein JW960_12300 [candidate division KSB1 bacterium]|nr:hypothetical protein [candidate division KSB1 bacterium]